MTVEQSLSLQKLEWTCPFPVMLGKFEASYTFSGSVWLRVVILPVIKMTQRLYGIESTIVIGQGFES